MSKVPLVLVAMTIWLKQCFDPQGMTAQEKGKFEDKAKLDKVRYEREMKTYIPPHTDKKKRFKDPNAPKRPS